MHSSQSCVYQSHYINNATPPYPPVSILSDQLLLVSVGRVKVHNERGYIYISTTPIHLPQSLGASHGGKARRSSLNVTPLGRNTVQPDAALLSLKGSPSKNEDNDGRGGMEESFECVKGDETFVVPAEAKSDCRAEAEDTRVDDIVKLSQNSKDVHG